jgi:hypothetical protein
VEPEKEPVLSWKEEQNGANQEQRWKKAWKKGWWDEGRFWSQRVPI